MFLCHLSAVLMLWLVGVPTRKNNKMHDTMELARDHKRVCYTAYYCAVLGQKELLPSIKSVKVFGEFWGMFVCTLNACSEVIKLYV